MFLIPHAPESVPKVRIDETLDFEEIVVPF